MRMEGGCNTLMMHVQVATDPMSEVHDEGSSVSSGSDEPSSSMVENAHSDPSLYHAAAFRGVISSRWSGADGKRSTAQDVAQSVDAEAAHDEDWHVVEHPTAESQHGNGG